MAPTVTTAADWPGGRWCRMDSPIGVLTRLADDNGLRRVSFETEHKQVLDLTDLPERPDDPVLATAVTQLNEYFAGERQDFDLPLYIEGTDFEEDVWWTLDTIPYGQTMSYGEQAAAVGRAGGAQAVGSANGRTPLAIVLPCHRVIGADGAMVGFGGGVPIKRWLLDHESGTQRLF